MVRPSKLYKQMLASRASMSFADFQRVLEAFGFTLDRIKASHHIYKHPSVPRPLSVQRVGKMAKAYQIGQFLDNVEEFGLTIDE